jgi:hypothetical protein
MMRCRKVLLLAAAVFLSVAAAPADKNAPGDAAWESPTVPWDDIVSTARHVVDGEATAAMLPFKMPSPAALAASPRKVFIYYFPFFLSSMDNKPIAEDHWTVDYMRRSGENGKFTDAGGFSRERPLPVGPWPSPYWRQIDETIDVLRAQTMGVDGFGVGIQDVSHGFTFAISEGVCYAAAHAAPGFHVFPEPDAAVLKGTSPQLMADVLAYYDKCPAALKLSNGHALVAPFAPDNEDPAYWTAVLDRMKAAGDTTDFIPVLIDPGRSAGAFSRMSSALSSWGYRDPMNMASAGAIAVASTVRQSGKSWMQPIAPQDSRPKSLMFWESRNTEAFRKAWMGAIDGKAAYAHIITWNDYSEATEIAPSSGIQFLYYDLSMYYTAWFKAGTPPPILRDAIYYCYRNQIFDPDHPPLATDKPYKRFGETPLSNDIEMVAMLTKPATLEIQTAGGVFRQPAPAGLTSFRANATAGRPRFRIIRDNKVVTEKIGDWDISAHPTAESPLYFGGSSTRAFRPMLPEIAR